MTSVAFARRALTEAFRTAGLETPELDARLLVAHALDLSHAALVAQADRALTADDWRRVAALRDRRLEREPVARILGRKEFWSLELVIDAHVLDPRPETETVVEAALDAVDRTQPLFIADLGTGSGAILLALLHELSAARGIGTDRSEAAVLRARANAAALGLTARSGFVVCDFGAALAGGFDLVVANPPYIRSADIAGLAPEVRRHDPPLSLDGGNDGLDAYRAIADDAQRLLAPHGLVVVEIGLGQASAVTALLQNVGLTTAPPLPDLAGIPRTILARRTTR